MIPKRQMTGHGQLVQTLLQASFGLDQLILHEGKHIQPLFLLVPTLGHTVHQGSYLLMTNL
jgi:hypothetical protein